MAPRGHVSISNTTVYFMTADTSKPEAQTESASKTGVLYNVT